MNSGRHDRVSQLFLEAIGLPPDERHAFLEEHCAGDIELIREVEELIEHDTRPAAVDNPVIDRAFSESAMAATSRDPQIPKRIAQYDIVDILGRGGMGVVYRARQTNPSREVALKVVHPYVTSATLSRRVEFEAQVLARLQHPGIAQIFEAGTDHLESRPLSFFAMELVDGVPIDKYVREKRLSTGDRLALLMKVCDAVHHAHQKGVIHRDLKPANILVTPSGLPKVLDFGIARVTDADIKTTTLRTNVGQLVGTIAYMSPEQVSGRPDDIDTRSDVYALGVLAYELLTGSLPYDLENKTVPDAAQIIRDHDPTMLGTIDRGYRGDIEVIIGKALEKDKARRYASVAEFSSDMDRHLRSEPIAARRPSMMYQLGKFARRNTALVGGVAVAFVLLVASVLVTSILYLQAETARVNAQTERDAAIEARSSLREANEALEDETDKLVNVNTFMRRMLESANPLGEIGYASKDITVLEMLDREAATLDQSFADRPAMEAAMRSTFGSIYAGLGRYADAEDQYRRALDLHWKTGGQHNDTARAIRDLAAVLTKTDRVDEAIQWFLKALAMNRQLNGEDSLETGITECRYGYALSIQRDYDQAEKVLTSSLDKMKRFSTPELMDYIPRTKNNLASVYSAKGRYDEAESLYREALAGFREFYGDMHATVASGTNNVAQMCMRRGDYDGALAGYLEAARIIRHTAGDDHPMLGTFLNNIAYVQEMRGQSEDAVQAYRDSLAIIEKAYGRAHREYMTTLYNLAFALSSTNQTNEALAAYETVFAFRKARHGPEHQRSLMAEFHTARCRAVLGNDDDAAERGLKHAFEGIQKHYAIDHEYTQKMLKALIEFYDARERSSDADSLRPLLKSI